MTERDLMEEAKIILKLIFVIQMQLLRKNEKALSHRDYTEKDLNLILGALVGQARPKIC